jgi:hypothetical protein
VQSTKFFKSKNLPPFLGIILLLVLTGCTRVGDYVGASHGYVTLGMKQKFGDGGEKKNYYALDEMTIIAPGALKPDVREKLGLPDKVESNIEGYEIWIYESRNIKLFFEKEKFKEWVYTDDHRRQTQMTTDISRNNQ